MAETADSVGGISLTRREELSPVVVDELESLVARILGRIQELQDRVKALEDAAGL